MPKNTKPPSDKTIVARLEELGGVYDQEAKTWTIPTENELGLRRLLADIGRPVEWRDADAEAA
jgi:hypothetical protein